MLKLSLPSNGEEFPTRFHLFYLCLFQNANKIDYVEQHRKAGYPASYLKWAAVDPAKPSEQLLQTYLD